MFRFDETTTDVFISDLEVCDTTDAVWRVVVDLFDGSPFNRISYHVMPLYWATTDQPPQIRTNGFSEDWVRRYHSSRLWLVDPIPMTAIGRSVPFLWSEIVELRELTQAEEDYIELLAEARQGNGLAVQVFGPNGRSGYFGLGFGDSKPALSRGAVRQLQWVCQLAHHRYCEVDTVPAAALSGREREVLYWVARGKSNSAIAEILAISSYTVDAYMRRIYQKLGVNDRVSAAIQGLGSGLIKAAA
ncbi:helix-turn-helix transcriptional regulator [Pontivivens ytuae]|uniref:LuxR family transcriptional regulator n=1 Tax=Pontivivens ytuae TaxID=2789856 RepID=A0A7S9LRE5_9RHOB|nr:LuxR family transcriptional regulator [Pontivivens ytuae]QPH53863.1 LuxR family transcriptional regulator [Pontivivens ytuae]